MGRYSLQRRDKKIAGVCADLGEVFAIDPTLIRLGFVGFALMIEFQVAVIAYIALGIYLGLQRRKGRRPFERAFERGPARGHDRFERALDGAPRRTSIKQLRDTLDVNDRRMMAIDQHLATQNDALAREIEALREDK